MTIIQVYLVCLTYGLINLLNICLLIVLANVHDIKIAKSKKQNKVSKNHTFSVIIPAHNEEKVIVRCLESMLKIDHQLYELVIVNDGSTDDTSRLVSEFVDSYNNSKIAGRRVGIKFIDLHKNGGKARALNEGLKAANGEIVVCMDADATFGDGALTLAEKYFSDPNVAVVAVNNKLVTNNSWLSLMQRFDFLSNYRSKKAYDILNAEYIVSGIGAMYRRTALNRIGGIPINSMTEDIDTSLSISLLGNKANRIRYAEDIVTYMEPVHTFKDLLKQRFRWKFGNMQAMYSSRSKLFGGDEYLSGWLRFWRFPLAIWGELSMLIELFFLGFMIWVSLIEGNGYFLLASYFVATFMCALTLLSDDSEPIKSRLKLLRYVGVMYFLSYVMNVVQLYASIKSLKQIKQLWKPAQGYSWNSPKRKGTVL